VCLRMGGGGGGAIVDTVERFEFRKKWGFSSLDKLPSTALCAVSLLAMECIIMVIYVYAVELRV
jgi:hypothetical protein